MDLPKNSYACLHALDVKLPKFKFNKMGAYSSFVFVNREMRHMGKYLQNISTSLKMEFILGHGALIGTLFNGESLPWDDDYDISVFDYQVYKLKRYLANLPTVSRSLLPLKTQRENVNNQNIQFYKDGDILWYHDWNTKHHIPFRAMRKSGVYTDFLVLSNSSSNPKFEWKACITKRYAHERPPFYYHTCKLWGSHVYTYKDMLPLMTTSINGCVFACPRRARRVLRKEYGKFKFKFSYNESSGCWYA